jgi:hypothetical protein
MRCPEIPDNQRIPEIQVETNHPLFMQSFRRFSPALGMHVFL